MAYTPSAGEGIHTCPKCGAKVTQSKLKIHVAECKGTKPAGSK